MPPRAGESGPAPWLPWKPLSVNFIFCLAQLSYRFRKRERNWEMFPSQIEAEKKTGTSRAGIESKLEKDRSGVGLCRG